MDPRLRLFGSLALIGASRRLPSFPESEFPAGSLIRELADASDASPESLSRVLLCGAGALFVCNLAGHRPVSVENAPELPRPCPEETRALLPEGVPVTDVMGEIFRGGPLRLQWEALAHLEKKNMVLPHSLLVPALVMGRGAPALRPLLARTAGERGLWLASLNPDWRMFAASSDGEPDQDAWEHGRPMQRQAFFLAARTKDPAQARELFEKNMASMDASERVALLGLFSHGLSGEDEELLERLLKKDRSREVKKTAALLLSRLPKSAYLSRMGERLAACMEGFLSAPKPSALSGLFRAAAAAVGMADKADFIAPPESYDKSWAEDLITEKSPIPQLGLRAGWLYQMACVMPPSWWTERTGREPEELIALSARSEWKKPLQMAWGDAELRFGDEDWARAMLKFMKKGDVWPSSSGRLDVFYLAGLLNREERERAWESLLSGETLTAFLEDVRSRQELGYRMSSALADKAVQALGARLSSASRRDYALAYVVAELAMTLPSDRLDKALQVLAALPEDSLNREIFDRFSAVALQRRTMDAYFS